MKNIYIHFDNLIVIILFDTCPPLQTCVTENSDRAAKHSEPSPFLVVETPSEKIN